MDPTFDRFFSHLLEDMHRRAHKTKDHHHIHLSDSLFVRFVFCVFQINCRQPQLFYARTHFVLWVTCTHDKQPPKTTNLENERLPTFQTDSHSIHKRWFANIFIFLRYFHFRISLIQFSAAFSISQNFYSFSSCDDDHHLNVGWSMHSN